MLKRSVGYHDSGSFVSQLRSRGEGAKVSRVEEPPSGVDVGALATLKSKGQLLKKWWKCVEIPVVSAYRQ